MPPIQDYDWEHSVYGKHEEDIAENLPEPLGKRIVLPHYFNASLVHDILSGKAVTGVCTFYNKTPVDWYCKQQSKSETAMYGSLITEHIFETLESQLVRWTMYGETMRAWSITQQYLNPS